MFFEFGWDVGACCFADDCDVVAACEDVFCVDFVFWVCCEIAFPVVSSFVCVALHVDECEVFGLEFDEFFGVSFVDYFYEFEGDRFGCLFQL